MNDALHIWTVYDHPSDYPHSFVARLYVSHDGRDYVTNQVIEADTLDALRAMLPPGLYRMPRDVRDDPCIVETWL